MASDESGILIAAKLSPALSRFKKGAPPPRPCFAPPVHPLSCFDMNTIDRPDLLSLEPDELQGLLSRHFDARGEPPYRTGQVRRWIYDRLAGTADAMTDLPAAERDALGSAFRIDDPAADRVSESRDGTVKHLWRLADGHLVESVLIPTDRRLTLCISSQAGCPMGCTFCATGWGGFDRQLTAGEIVGQYRGSRRWAEERGQRR